MDSTYNRDIETGKRLWVLYLYGSSPGCGKLAPRQSNCGADRLAYSGRGSQEDPGLQCGQYMPAG
jgi:hypothetical protein